MPPLRPPRTLRARLTLHYVVVTGVLFLVFSAAIYFLVNKMLTDQIDYTLRDTAQTVLQHISMGKNGRLTITLPPDISRVEGGIIQMWDRQGRLLLTTESAATVRPLSASGLSVQRPTFLTERRGKTSWRILSEPIFLGRRRIATLEVGVSLHGVTQARRTLAIVLLEVTLGAMFTTAVVGYISVNTALEPLEHVAAAADQITRADDLARRIPIPPNAGEEVNHLVQAFNATLGRLEALFQAQRRFIADVGHELRTPLTVIKGNAQWMQRIGELDPEALASIEEETDRLSRLVDDLLLLARAEAGKLPLRRETVDLDALSAEVLREMQVMARDKVTLKAELRPLRVCGDADRLKQVLINLVSNAIKYTPAGGQVTLRLEEAGAWGVCRVIDTGQGIPPEDLPHVFERFYRADKARSRGQGFGLGLSIAYWIVKHHGGRIEVASQVGQGTTFSIYLPLWQEETCADPETAA